MYSIQLDLYDFLITYTVYGYKLSTEQTQNGKNSARTVPC